MNRPPPRLRDDPAFAELFRAEREAIGPFDLHRLRRRVLRHPWRGPLRLGGTLAGVSLIGGALWFGAAAPPALRPSVRPALEVLATGELRSAPALRVSPPVAAPAVAAPAEAAGAPPAVSAPVDIDESAGLPEPPSPRSPGRLQAELADYDAARGAADERRWDDARGLYRRYLERWPEGRLREEARLGLLTALVHAGQPEEVERMAARMLANPQLAHRHAEIRIVRAEALVRLRRCAEARETIRGLPRSHRVVAVRAACRGRGW